MYRLHKSRTPGAAKQQNRIIIVKTAIITIRVANPWGFEDELVVDEVFGSETNKTK